MHAPTPHPHRRALLLSALLGLCPLALGAQPGARIWRCGNQYTDQPCASGSALAPAGTPNEDARAEADAATQRMRQQADAMARDRERREAAAAGRAPAVIEHRSPWASSDDEEDGSRTRLKRPRRPKTEKGRNPKTEGFTAKGSATGKSGNSR